MTRQIKKVTDDVIVEIVEMADAQGKVRKMARAYTKEQLNAMKSNVTKNAANVDEMIELLA